MIRAWIAIACALAASGCDRLAGTPYRWQLPPGFPEPTVPADNPMTVEKVALGRRLFFDARLSANGTQSCASCHLPTLAFAESAATATGSTGQRHRRNSMSLTNVAYNATFTWAHSGITTLEQHMLLPLFGDQPIEMGAAGHEQEILERLRTDAAYRQLFAAAFPWSRDRINFDHVVKSLASFTRTLISFNSPFDGYAFYGDDAALTEAQIRGMNLFMSERLECAHCHNGFNFSQFVTHESATVQDRAFHITGLNYLGDQPMPGFDYGLYHVTADPADKDKFKAPTLRNIEITAPYMHDGSLESLSDVVDFYAAGGRGAGRDHPGKSPFIRGFELSEQEKQDLLAFLSSLTDKEFLANPAFANESSHE